MMVRAKEMILLLKEVAAFATRPEFGSLTQQLTSVLIPAPRHPVPSSVLWHLHSVLSHTKIKLGSVFWFLFSSEQP